MKTKVLHIIKNLELGGAETNLLNLVRAFDGERFESHVAYSKGGELEERFKARGAVLFKYSSRNHRLKSPATAVIVSRLASYVMKNDIRIVHTHNFNGHVWGCLAAKLAGRKVVEHVHDFRYLDFEEFRRRKGSAFQYRYIRFFKKMADRLIVLTRQNYEYVLRHGYGAEKNVREIQNGIPLDGPQPSGEGLRRAAGVPEGAPVIFTAARLSDEKNIGLVLDVARELAATKDDAWFVIAGDGPLSAPLRARAEAEHLDRVRFVGFQDNILGWLSVSDVFFLPSFLELHSIAILEALSLGVAVVAAKGTGCNDEFIDHGVNGLLLDPFSGEGWAGAIRGLVRDPARRAAIGKKGRELCVERFDIRKTARKIEDVYAELA